MKKLVLVALIAGSAHCAWDAKPACGPGSDHGPCPVPIPPPTVDPDHIFSAKGAVTDGGVDAGDAAPRD